MVSDDLSFMARFGARLVDNGYAVLPIMPGTKKPGRWRRGAWVDYAAWTRHCGRATTEHELAVWSTWPDAAVGIACGTAIALDVDVEDAGLAHAIERLARTRLGDTPALRIGRAPKRLLVYRAREPFAGFKRAPLEVLGLGRQFVAYGTHPGTGRPYTWPEESPVDLALEDLPAVDEAEVRAFVDAAYARVPAALRPNDLGSGEPAPREPRAASELRGTPEAIASALAHLPNADLHYDSWIRVGLALKGALGDDGRELFERWSAQSSKNVPATTARTWAAFQPRGIGAGTIYHHALEAGWTPGPELTLAGGVRVNGRHPARALLDRLSGPRPTSPEPAAAPLAALAEPAALDGALGDLVGYMLRTAKRPQPLLALGAGLCALGALMGRRYRTETNLRSNLYVVGVADSGSGKNHGREVVNELLVEAGLGHHLGGNRIASGSGLLTALHRQPAILFQLDEFGMFLAAAADRRRSPRHITDILDTMTELYTAAGTIFLGAEYANRDGRNERRDINQPCLCVYGTTTPLHFWGALRSANVADGSLARFLVLQTEDDYPDENAAAGLRRSPPALLEALATIAAGGGRRPGGNLANLTSGPATAVDPMTVPASAEARRMFRALSREITAELREARGTHATSILARIAENALKVALVRAVAADPVRPVIRAVDAEWAIALVRGSARRTLLEVERHVADNEIEANHKRVLAVVRAAGPAGLTRSELIRRTQFLDKRQRDDILGALTEGGLITTAMRQSATRPGMVFCAVEAAP